VKGDGVNLEAERNDREVFRRVFGTIEGKSVLAWILNACGYFSCDGEMIRPEQTAFCNTLLHKVGIIHAANLFEDTSARVDAANDRDIEFLLKREAEEAANG
jgi:hypothetical protein